MYVLLVNSHRKTHHTLALVDLRTREPQQAPQRYNFRAMTLFWLIQRAAFLRCQTVPGMASIARSRQS